MRRKRALLFINMCLLLVMIAFNNCGQPGEIRVGKLPSSLPTSGDNNNQDAGAVPVDPGAPDIGGVRPPAVVTPENPGVTEPAYQKMEKVITLSETDKADVLFVVDNSYSMADEQKNMSSRFPLFIKNLRTIDWRVGVITTDVDNPALSYADGKLQMFANSSRYLDSKIPELDAETLFAQVIQRKESGSPYEQGIYATYRFLEREKVATSPFMRPDASVNVVFIADADETPYEGSNGLPIIQKRNKPEELVKYLKANWPMKKFQFHAIVVNEGDADCLDKSANESYGLAYEKLAKETNGVRGSVCAEDYGKQLLFLSEKIKDLVKTVKLDCEPVYDEAAKQYRVSIHWDGPDKIEIEKVEKNEIILKGSLPVGTIKLEYFCSTKMLSN
ncbi:MAG: hypothetical protein JNL11_07175 [Bdellovibrionaceae bacterium]|nr:hypothetical protein [Pseudobdellovibrionaceae bacterium]